MVFSDVAGRSLIGRRAGAQQPDWRWADDSFSGLISFFQEVSFRVCSHLYPLYFSLRTHFESSILPLELFLAQRPRFIYLVSMEDGFTYPTKHGWVMGSSTRKQSIYDKHREMRDPTSYSTYELMMAQQTRLFRGMFSLAGKGSQWDRNFLMMCVKISSRSLTIRKDFLRRDGPIQTCQRQHCLLGHT